MATLGYGDLKDQIIHPLWDLTEMKKVAMVGGRTFDEMVQEVQDMANEFNRSMVAMPHYSDLWVPQDNVEIEYAVGVSGGVQEATEYSVPDPYIGKITGHNIPVKNWSRSLGWTMKGLKKRSEGTIIADLTAAVTDMRTHFQQRLLTRFFKMEAEAVGATAGASVPFADGGVSDANYVPLPSPEGKSFLSTHDHYLRHATPLTDANLAITLAHLAEHGHIAPFEVWGSEADAAEWQALTGWKNPEWPDLLYHANADIRAAIGDIQTYRGFVETPLGVAKVWLSERIPTGYYTAFRTYGTLDPRNPLRMRIDPDYGFGWFLMPGQYVNAPRLLAVLESYYDFGIGADRTAAVFTLNAAAGDYISPTIT